MKNKTAPKTQAELFIAEFINGPMKDDIHSMEYPIYSLSKNKDNTVREYINERTNKTLRIIPSGFGAATIFDKDILIYAMSQIINALNKKSPSPVSRNIRFATIDYINATGKNGGGEEFIRIIDALRRLRGTTLETNIKTGDVIQTEGFGLIEEYKVTRKNKTGKGALEIEITLSEWIYNALMQFEVLTIPHSYFQITQAIERRIYELSRKHIGKEGAYWICNIETFQEKTGARSDKYAFKRDLKNIIEADNIPDYRLALDINKKPAHVVCYTQDNPKLLHQLTKNQKLTWFHTLKRGKKFDPPSVKIGYHSDIYISVISLKSIPAIRYRQKTTLSFPYTPPLNNLKNREKNRLSLRKIR